MNLSLRGGIFRSYFTRYTLWPAISSRNIETDGNVPNDLRDMPIEMDNPFQREKIQCILCKLKIQPNYKNTKLLSQFVSPFTGRLYGRHITGLCKKKQEEVKLEIMKAQNAALMPYYNKEPVYLEDPVLFNPAKPIRCHDF